MSWSERSKLHWIRCLSSIFCTLCNQIKCVQVLLLNITKPSTTELAYILIITTSLTVSLGTLFGGGGDFAVQGDKPCYIMLVSVSWFLCGFFFFECYGGVCCEVWWLLMWGSGNVLNCHSFSVHVVEYPLFLSAVTMESQSVNHRMTFAVQTGPGISRKSLLHYILCE